MYTFVFVSKVRQADILYDEAQREVEKCGNSKISGTWDVETCSKQSYNQVTTRLQPPVPLNHFPKWLRNSGNLVTTITIASVLRRLAEAEGLKRAEEDFQLILSEYHVMCVSS